MRSSSISYLFFRLCRIAGLPDQAAARLARRSFITAAGRRARSLPGVSLRDVQAMSGQRSLESVQALVEIDERSQRRIVDDLFREH
jgi:hypothetical protein